MFYSSPHPPPTQQKKKTLECIEKWSTKDRVGRTPSNLVLSGITYQALIVSEGNIGRHHFVALLVG